MAYSVVSHADTGITTLHRQGCPATRRAIYVEQVDTPPEVDHVCIMCKPLEDSTCPA